jgi:ribonuclease III
LCRSRQLQSSPEHKLGYHFSDSALLQLALTHRSFGADHNERLEYLGDSFLNFVIARAVYLRFPLAPEGDLSRLRAQLVRGTTLALIARELGLEQHLRMGVGERKTGGAQRDSNLANAVEAVIGAILLDGGEAVCAQRILAWFDERIAELSTEQPLKDPKSLLQEYLQGRNQGLPEYAVVSIGGAEHQQAFTVRCTIAAIKKQTDGNGSSRKRAEQEAANAMLQLLGIVKQLGVKQ